MQHCNDCHKDYERYFEHKKECEPKEIDCETCGSIDRQEFREFLYKESKRRDGLKENLGAFGENHNKGFVEWENKGTKYYGCNYINPIIVENDVIDRLAITKRAIMELVKLFSTFPFVLLAPLFIFKPIRKRVIEFVIRVYEADLEKHEPDWWNRVAQTLIEAGDNYVEMEREKKFVRCIAMIPQYDSGYYFRIQDFLNLWQEYGMKAFDKAIERENSSLKWKYKYFKWLMYPLKGELHKLLDGAGVKPTEDERYFAYRRTYDFEGIPKELRKAWVERKDKEHNNIILDE